MSILGNIKKGVASSGSNRGKVLFVKSGTKKRVRFLHEVESGLEVTIHDSFDKGINALCLTHLGEDCPYCEDGDGIRTRQAYVWSVWDVDDKEVKLFVGYANNFNPLPALISMYESYGTLIDRDYVISREGTQTNTRYGVVPMDKVRFKNTKAKPYTEEKVIDILSKAYPANDDTEDEEEKPAKKKTAGKKKPPVKRKPDPEPEEDEDDDIEENEYDAMSPRELYVECIERGLKAKKKQKKEYYIDMLVEDDEKTEDGWDDEEDEDEDGEW